jgi:hypothetical protein
MQSNPLGNDYDGRGWEPPPGPFPAEDNLILLLINRQVPAIPENRGGAPTRRGVTAVPPWSVPVVFIMRGIH